MSGDELGAVAAAAEKPARAENLAIVDGWLVDDSGQHTCNGGDEASSGHHEPHCGLEPLMKVTELGELFDALTAAGMSINRVPVELPRLLAGAAATNAEETAHAWQYGAWTDHLPALPLREKLAAAQSVTDWLRARAKKARDVAGPKDLAEAAGGPL